MTSQSRRSKRAKKINKSVLIELEVDGEKYYKSYLQSYRDGSLVLQSEVDDYDKITYEENIEALEDFDYIRITDKKQTFKKSAITGLLVGVTSFFVVKELTKNTDVTNLAQIRQTGSSGTAEGLIASGVGVGLGILLYDGIANKKLNVIKDREKILTKLKSVKL